MLGATAATFAAVLMLVLAINLVRYVQVRRQQEETLLSLSGYGIEGSRGGDFTAADPQENEAELAEERTEEFPEKVNRGEYSNWEALAAINVILDPQTSFQQLDDMLKNGILEDNLTPFCDTQDFCDTIRELNFAIEENSDNFIVKYLFCSISFESDYTKSRTACQQSIIL